MKMNEKNTEKSPKTERKSKKRLVKKTHIVQETSGHNIKVQYVTKKVEYTLEEQFGKLKMDQRRTRVKGREVRDFYRNLHMQRNRNHRDKSSGSDVGERSNSREKRPRNEDGEFLRPSEGSSFNHQKMDGRDDACSSRAGRPSRPSHLRGKEIGLWYRDQARLRTDPDKEKKKSVNITISSSTIRDIRNCLNLTTLNSKNVSNVFSSFVDNPDIKSNLKNEYLRVINTDFETAVASAQQKGSNSPDWPENDNVIDNVLYEDFIKTQMRNEAYSKMQLIREKLPALNEQVQILELIRANQIILIKGETGCGKTTQVPQFILDEAIISKRGTSCNIICTQPRRISAITLSERVASERGERLQESVGYQIRLDVRKPSQRGSILYCTTGVVLKFLESDPCLNEYSHLILDEIHERDVITDVLLGIIKMVLPYRKDLKVILMSATLTAEKFSKYFNNCPMIEIKGFTYPVQQFYLEDVLQKIRFFDFPEEARSRGRGSTNSFEFKDMIDSYARTINKKYSREVYQALTNPNSEIKQTDLIVDLVHHIVSTSSDGAILVFFPSLKLISDTQKALTSSSKLKHQKILVYPLHSRLPQLAQKEVFQKPPQGVRKIILSTNIAETSITIEDVVFVINSGKQKLESMKDNISQLRDEWISLSNETQRKGRAGRVQPGICYHLYSRARRSTFVENTLPEILRVPLEEVILTIKILCLGDTRVLLSKLMDEPEDNLIRHSIGLLTRLNAIDDKETLTPLGYHLAKLPMDPRTGKMILLAGIFGCVDPITSIAASLTFKEAFTKPFGKEREVDKIKRKFAADTHSDHLMLAHVITEWKQKEAMRSASEFCWNNFLNMTTLNQLYNMKGQFCELLHKSKFLANLEIASRENNIHSNNTKLLKSLICAGLYPNIAFVKRVIKPRNTAEGFALLNIDECGSAKIHPSSVNGKLREFESNYLVYHTKMKINSTLFVFDCTIVNPFPILFFGDTHVESCEDFEYISVAGHVCFKCNKETFKLISDLRKGFDLFLQKKICSPSPVDWNSEEGILLRAIISLITIDGKYKEDFEDDDEDFNDDDLNAAYNNSDSQ